MPAIPCVNASESLEWLMTDKLAELNQHKLARISSGRPVLDLSMINPDIEPPRFMIDRLVEASLRPDRHRYAVSRGVRKLREAFVLKYKQSFGVRLDPETEICATMGAKEAIVHALMCLAAPKALALIGTPSYPAHLSALQLAGFGYEFFAVANQALSLNALVFVFLGCKGCIQQLGAEQQRCAGVQPR